MHERHDAVVIGAGQAGLAISRELSHRGIDHVVLERNRVGSSWAGLWESFCLNTPGWSIQLPGLSTEGIDPEAFLPRGEIVTCLERYAKAVGAPVREGVEVRSLDLLDRRFRIQTQAEGIEADSVVVCTGAYQRTFRPPGAQDIPSEIPVLDVRTYREPGALPEGAVLVVGSGQSGCQIAEDLLDGGREVIVSVGKAAWFPRRVLGRDALWWVMATGLFEQTVDELPSPAARLAANVTVSGVGGGHDVHPRVLRERGAILVGRFLGVEGGSFRFADDLARSVAWSDDRYREFAEDVVRVCTERGLGEPDLPEPEPFDPVAPSSIDVSRIASVVLTGGFRPDYGWVHVPGGFDDMGFPIQRDGASTVAPGLAFAGVHFLRKRKSSLLIGIGEDAPIVARGIADHLKR